MLKMKQVIVVSLVTLLCACGVIKLPENKTSNESTYNKWVGRSVDELIIANGEPSDISSIDGGGRVFEYSNIKNATTSTQSSSTQPSLPGVNSSKAQRIRANRKKLASDPSQDCKILFNVSASDIIESWSTEGANCN